MSDSTNPAPVDVLPEHAKVVDRLDRLRDRLGELRRHL